MKMESDEEEDADKLLQEEIVFLVSGLYLILVGILGAGFNIRALTKAKRVSQLFYLVNQLLSMPFIKKFNENYALSNS